MCGWQTKTTQTFIFLVEDKLCNLLGCVELLPTVWMVHTHTDTFSLFIRLHCSTPPESKQLFLDVPVCLRLRLQLHRHPSFSLEAQLYHQFRLFWPGIQLSSALPNRAPASRPKSGKKSQKWRGRGRPLSVCSGTEPSKFHPAFLSTPIAQRQRGSNFVSSIRGSHPVLAHRSALLLRTLLFMRPRG